MKTIVNILTMILFISTLNAEDIKMNTQIKSKVLIVDHIMFPVYNNDAFLDEIKEIWTEKKVGEIERADYDAYSAVFFKTRNFYVEYLSTNKGDGWWVNRICVEVDTTYWDYYKNPFSKDGNFLIPEIDSGFFLVSPHYDSVNSKINTDINYSGFTIYISEILKDKLINVCGLKWELPDYIRTNKNLIYERDIVVVDEDGEYIAPYLQCNTPWIYK